MKMEERLLAVGSYLSVFIAPLLFPFLVYFLSSCKVVKYHAKKAIISHILPVLWMVTAVMFLLYIHTAETSHIVMLFLIAGAGLLNFVIVIWNVGNGIRVLIRE